MAGLQYDGGIVMFVIGIILIMSIMAIFPMTLKLVQPIFQYIEIQPTEGIITIFVALGVVAIPGGIHLFRPGYKEIWEKYLEYYMNKF